MAWYIVDLFSLSSRKYLVGGSTYLGYFLKSGGLRGVGFFIQSFTWWCFWWTQRRRPMISPRRSSCGEMKILLSHTSASVHYSPRCRETSVWNLGHYRWDGRWLGCLLSVKRVGCFCKWFVSVSGCWSECHFHQRKESYCLQGRRCIRWNCGSWILSPVSIHIPIWCVIDFQFSEMLKSRSWEYSLDWCTIMGGMNNLPSARVKKINVHQNGDRSPIFTLHIFHLEITCKYRWSCSVFHKNQPFLKSIIIPSDLK